MKPVLLHILFNNSLEFENIECDTVKEAQETAEVCEHFKPTFHIYTLYSQGIPKGIEWNLDTDHATNLRENKKAAVPRGSSTWTDLEAETLVKNYKDGMKISQVAKSLGRSYNACYSKLVSEGAFVPIPRK